MWISFSRLVLCLYLCTSAASGYRGTRADLDKWREQHSSRNHRSSPPTTTTTPRSVNSQWNYDRLKVRHPSRFPNLDRVMTRIDNMDSISDNSVSRSYYHRARHSGAHRTTSTTTTTTTAAPDEDLFEEYGDFEYEDEDVDDNLQDSNDLLEDVDDDGLEYDDEDSYYLDDPELDDEETTEDEESSRIVMPQQSRTSSYSSISNYKWENYGTREKVEESRRNELHLQPNNQNSEMVAVMNHFMRLRHEGLCKRPSPKVIPVQSIHSDLSKTYVPHCTILHRCAADTGCCQSDAYTCAPKVTSQINLYFYTKTMGSTEMKVEKLSFDNHTECHCVEKSKLSTSVPTRNTNSEHDVSPRSSPGNMERCKCPEEFTPRLRYTTGCTCDCREGNEDCNQMKRGKEYLSLVDRKCIIDNLCGLPVCEYGAYLRHKGRCPRKEEKFEEFGRLNISN